MQRDLYRILASIPRCLWLTPAANLSIRLTLNAVVKLRIFLPSSLVMQCLRSQSRILIGCCQLSIRDTATTIKAPMNRDLYRILASIPRCLWLTPAANLSIRLTLNAVVKLRIFLPSSLVMQCLRSQSRILIGCCQLSIRDTATTIKAPMNNQTALLTDRPTARIARFTFDRQGVSNSANAAAVLPGTGS